MQEARLAAVAGTFYAAEPEALRRQIAWCFEHPLGPDSSPPPAARPSIDPRALVVPHAGYRYSGPVAAHCYNALRDSGRPDLVVILGPNHRMVGEPIAVPSSNVWRTPLGEVPIDLDAAQALCSALSAVTFDDRAHHLEHSVEVQLPFLQYLFDDQCPILPIVTYEQHLDTYLTLGHAIANALGSRRLVVVASSDLTHYESHESARRNDRRVLGAIEALDIKELLEVIFPRGVSMCGPGPLIAMINAGLDLGATHGRTLCYATSGDMSGDYDYVVGYAALAVE